MGLFSRIRKLFNVDSHVDGHVDSHKAKRPRSSPKKHSPQIKRAVDYHRKPKLTIRITGEVLREYKAMCKSAGIGVSEAIELHMRGELNKKFAVPVAKKIRLKVRNKQPF